jgi:hypothetical protein
MDIKQAFLLAAAAVAAQQPVPLSYSTSCAVLDSGSADGYVTNLSEDTYQISGEVRLIFTRPGSMSRPAVTATADSLIPPGQTARVASVRLAFSPDPAGSCRFDVAGAIRRPKP